MAGEISKRKTGSTNHQVMKIPGGCTQYHSVNIGSITLPRIRWGAETLHPSSLRYLVEGKIPC